MKYVILFVYLLIFSEVDARPVSYPGGVTLMQMNDGYFSNLHLHYSPSIKYSIGLKIDNNRVEKWTFAGIQYNNLLKRINKKNSQANFYLKSAIGSTHSDEYPFSSYQVPAGFIGFAADWEDRRFFTSYENKSFYSSDIAKYFQQKVRFGIAPYIGNYGDLHTWFMVQIEHNPKKQNEELNVTPLLRFFKDVYLLESGVSLDGEIIFNVVVRF